MNALKEFLSKNIKVNSSASLKKDDLLQKYNEFCLESKSELLSSVQFQKQLKEMYPSIQLKRIGRLNGTQLYYEGITFTTSTTCINADDKSPLVLILQKHHQSLSLLLANRRFTDAIQLMQDFWSNFQSTNSDGSEDESFEKLLELEGEFYNNTFNLFFNSNQVLIPIPLDLLLEYRRFSKGILQVAKNGSSSLMLQQQQQESNSWFFLKRRLELLNVFHLLVLKYTTLNHLLQSVQPLFSSEEFISVHLRRELDQLDINQIINEYSLIVVDSTDVESVRQFYDRVYSLLFHTPFRITLLEELLALVNHEMMVMIIPSQNSTSFSLWSRFECFAQLIVRDLCLRSSPVFGSVLITKMFFDEYIKYLEEEKSIVRGC